MDSPSAVLFDFHDTLAELVGGTERVVASEIGVPVEEVRLAVGRAFAERVPLLRAEGVWPGQPGVMFHRLYEHVYEFLGLDADPAPVVDRLNALFWAADSYRAYPDAAPVLTRLRAAGLRLGVLSNSDFDLHQVLDHIDLADVIDVAVPAFLHGVEKPDRAAFELALDGLSVAASDCWFVGDHPEFDAIASHDLGMTAVLVDREDRHAATEWPFPRIRDLTPLPGMLGLA